MANRWGQAAAPAYLFLCLILGGSAQGIFANMILQLIGLGLIAAAAIVPNRHPLSTSERQLTGIIYLFLAIVAAQLVPLPASIWPQLGGRSLFAQGYGILGLPIPPFPISLAPYKSIATLLTVIPPFALLAIMLRVGARPSWMIFAMLAGLISGILLGVLQVSSPTTPPSHWYLYPETNVGLATGFFANANHMATLLVISIPFLAALLATARHRRAGLQHYSGVIALVSAAVVVVLVGLALNGSLAGYGLALPVVVASALLLLPARSRARRWVGLGTAALVLTVLVGLSAMPLAGTVIRTEAHTSVETRQEITATSVRVMKAFLPLGTGLGTFENVYAVYEDHARLDPTTSVNHAHNDYLEIAIELGLPGIVVMLLFLTWWIRTAYWTWSTSDSGPFARAATIASAAILVHSTVDFPLRTAAISGCFAMCLAFMVRWRPTVTPAVVEPSQLRPTRHLVIH